ncbi:hypothetical protein ACQKNX_04675 [Lysinibacillus sp. NPDC093712]|uniref:hypothetical protein n=1 Tax=Lysinibacillus sp. NPDC093712 TaxID=3390579 RepID=UPI003D057B30
MFSFFWSAYKREERQLKNLETLTAAQGEQASAMRDVSKSLTSLEGRMNRMEKHNFTLEGFTEWYNDD